MYYKVTTFQPDPLSLIVVRGIVDVYTHYWRTVITNKCVDYWMHGTILLKNLCTDHHGWKQAFLSKFPMNAQLSNHQ